MHVSKPVALVLGVATLWPPVYLAAFMSIFFSLALGIAGAAEQPVAPAFDRMLAFLFLGHFATMLISAGLLIFYIVHIFKNPALPDDRRILWTIIVFMGNIIAMPVYWFLYVWRDPIPQAPRPSAAVGDR